MKESVPVLIEEKENIERGENIRTRIVILRQAQARDEKYGFDVENPADITEQGREDAINFARNYSRDRDLKSQPFIRHARNPYRPDEEMFNPGKNAEHAASETAKILDNVFKETIESQDERSVRSRVGLLPKQKHSLGYWDNFMDVYNKSKESGKNPADALSDAVIFYVEDSYNKESDENTTPLKEVAARIIESITKIIRATKKFKSNTDTEVFMISFDAMLDGAIKLLLDKYQEEEDKKGLSIQELGGPIKNMEPLFIDVFRKNKDEYAVELTYRNIKTNLNI